MASGRCQDRDEKQVLLWGIDWRFMDSLGNLKDKLIAWILAQELQPSFAVKDDKGGIAEQIEVRGVPNCGIAKIKVLFVRGD